MSCKIGDDIKSPMRQEVIAPFFTKMEILDPSQDKKMAYHVHIHVLECTRQMKVKDYSLELYETLALEWCEKQMINAQLWVSKKEKEGVVNSVVNSKNGKKDEDAEARLKKERKESG